MGRHSDRNHTGGPPGMRVPEGARVLVARSPDRAGELVTALRRVGAEPLLLPLIDFEQASDQHSLDVAFDALGAGAYTWLVVSSVTTVQALEAKAAERGTSLQQLAARQHPRGHDRPGDPQFPGIRGHQRRPCTHGPAIRDGPARHLAREPGQRAPAPGRHCRPAAPQGPRGAGCRRPSRHRLPHCGLSGRSAPGPARLPAGHAATHRCSRAGRNTAHRAHHGRGESGSRCRPAARRRCRLAQRRPPHRTRTSPPLGNCRFVAIGRSTAAEAASLGTDGRRHRPGADPGRPGGRRRPVPRPPALSTSSVSRRALSKGTPYELSEPPPTPAPHHPGHAPAHGRIPALGLRS